MGDDEKIIYTNVDPITFDLDNPDTGTFSISLDTLDTDDVITASYDTTFSVDMRNYVYNSIPFKDTLPSLDRVHNMCDEYPALAKAYENFKTIYNMCEQDYKGKLKERGIDDDIPF